MIMRQQRDNVWPMRDHALATSDHALSEISDIFLPFVIHA